MNLTQIQTISYVELFLPPKRFYECDDAPAVIDGYGGFQSRLAAAGDAVADGFEKFARGFILDRIAA